MGVRRIEHGILAFALRSRQEEHLIVPQNRYPYGGPTGRPRIKKRL
jgi:hypothetical protein